MMLSLSSPCSADTNGSIFCCVITFLHSMNVKVIVNSCIYFYLFSKGCALVYFLCVLQDANSFTNRNKVQPVQMERAFILLHLAFRAIIQNDKTNIFILANSLGNPFMENVVKSGLVLWSVLETLAWNLHSRFTFI